MLSEGISRSDTNEKALDDVETCSDCADIIQGLSKCLISMSRAVFTRDAR
jgi:hypothetical protein